jgi:hypothetical protein
MVLPASVPEMPSVLRPHSGSYGASMRFDSRANCRAFIDEKKNLVLYGNVVEA